MYPYLLTHLRQNVSVKNILQFQQAFVSIHTEFPFSVAFGDTSNRTRCIKSSERLYWRLLAKQRHEEELRFETLCDIAHGSQTRIKTLNGMFQPDKEGTLSQLDFIKSIDRVYKELRFTVFSIQNARQIDQAYERILDIFFYFVLFCIALSILGISVLTFILLLSALIISFAFMIGSASSAYFQVSGIYTFTC